MYLVEVCLYNKGHEFFWKFIYNSSYSMELEPSLTFLTFQQIHRFQRGILPGWISGIGPEGRFLFHIPCKVDRYQI